MSGTDKTQTDFETWARRRHGFAVDDFEREEERYLLDDVQDVFEEWFAGYQAGRKESQAEVERLRAELIEANKKINSMLPKYKVSKEPL